MKRFLFALMTGLAAASLYAEEMLTPEKMAAIRELMEITQASPNGELLTDMFTQQIVSVLRARYPDLPESAVAIVKDEVRSSVGDAIDNESLQREIYPIYARYFTLAELRGLVRFNKTRVGQKANRVMPGLMRESMQAAENWSRQIGPGISSRVMDRLRSEGVELRN